DLGVLGTAGGTQNLLVHGIISLLPCQILVPVHAWSMRISTYRRSLMDGAAVFAVRQKDAGLVGHRLLDLLDVLLQAATDALDALCGSLHRVAAGHGGQCGNQPDQKRPAGCPMCDMHDQLHNPVM